MSVINNLPFFVVINDKKNNNIKGINQQFNRTFTTEVKTKENIESLLKEEQICKINQDS
jgi:hypothetical protein